MITCKLMFCAQGVVRDVETHNISAFNILEKLGSGKFPLFIQQMALLTLLEKDKQTASTHKSRIIVKIGEKELLNKEMLVDFKEQQSLRHVVNFTGIIIPKPGLMKFEFFINEEMLCSYQLEVLEKKVNKNLH